MKKAHEFRTIALQNANKYAIEEIEERLKSAAEIGEFSIEYTYSQAADVDRVNKTLVEHGYTISHLGSRNIKISFRYDTSTPF